MFRHSFTNASLIFFFLINIIFSQGVLRTAPLKYGLKHDLKRFKIDDLPLKGDLNKYVTALERIMNFFLRYKHHVDMNLEFGLFLINVHLRRVVTIKKTRIPTTMYKRLAKLLYENDKLILYFNVMVERSISSDKRPLAKITTLFANETLWVKKLPRLTFDSSIKRRSNEELRKIYSEPNIYNNDVYSFDKGMPSPKVSDACMVHLADNPVYDNFKRSPKCLVPSFCQGMLKTGTPELGYFICHRLLFLIAANLGRGCAVFSDDDDQSLMEDFCTLISDEAQYIAMNNYSHKDLLLEEVVLCSLSGKAHFLQRTWISEALRYQTKLGCFSEQIREYDDMTIREHRQWTLVKLNNDILNGLCNTHMSAVAASTLATGVRRNSFMVRASRDFNHICREFSFDPFNIDTASARRYLNRHFFS